MSIVSTQILRIVIIKRDVINIRNVIIIQYDVGTIQFLYILNLNE